MKLKLKNTPEQVELIKALGSRDANVSAEAATAFAAFIGPVIAKVIAHAGTAGMFYTDTLYDEDDSPSYPLDLYYDEGQGYVTIWSQNIAGGMPTSQVEGVAEMKIATYRIDTAVSWLKKWARKSRLDVVSKTLERMAQEVLVKQERNAWAVVVRALANAESSNSTGVNNGHILASHNVGEFIVNDLSRMLTLMRRLSASWVDGTPAGADAYGLTDLFVSPEIKEMVRGFAYNPMNVIDSPAGGTSHSTVALPDAVREDIFRAAGTQELWGVRLTDLLELGVGEKYTKLFDALGPSSAAPADIAHGSTGGSQGGTWANNTHQLMIGLDASRDAFIRPVAQQMDSGGTFTVLPDDQWVARADKTGFYGFLEEGRVCIDGRAIVGMVV
tara:strand:- start:3297 stop:4454 length:1158 start_codon:yes stop_codon:yes gene_type:complete